MLGNDRIGIIKAAAEERKQPGCAVVRCDDASVSEEPPSFRAHEGRTRETLGERRIGLYRENFFELKRRACFHSDEVFHVGLLFSQIQRANLLTQVAPEEPVAYSRPELGRYRALMLDGQV